MSGMELQMTDLAKYLAGKLDERNLSVRAFAMYAKLSHTTIREILDGRIPDHKTLNKLASYLGEPIETLYRLATILPPDTGKRAEVIRLIELLFEKLPASDQQEIVDIVRMKVERREKEQNA